MKHIIGIDEVGRGPVAGPVCVAALQLRIRNYELRIKNTKIPLRDSKKLSAKQREEWFAQIKKWKKEGIVDYAVSFVSAKKIDQIGIAPAIKLALSRSLLKLEFRHPMSKKTLVLLDGGLKAPTEYINQKTIIKGDEKEPAIALASIVAKVLRDRLMIKQAKKYPNYGFDSHKGYGTDFHYKNIRKFGITEIHRKSFLKRVLE